MPSTGRSDALRRMAAVTSAGLGDAKSTHSSTAANISPAWSSVNIALSTSVNETFAAAGSSDSCSSSPARKDFSASGAAIATTVALPCFVRLPEPRPVLHNDFMPPPCGFDVRSVWRRAAQLIVEHPRLWLAPRQPGPCSLASWLTLRRRGNLTGRNPSG